MWSLYGFFGVVSFCSIYFFSIIFVLAGILRLLEIYFIISVLVLRSNSVNVYFESVFGTGVIVSRIVAGSVFSVIEIGKRSFGCVVYYF